MAKGIRLHDKKAFFVYTLKKTFMQVRAFERYISLRSAYRIPQRIVQAVNAMYCNTRAKVVSPDGDKEQFMLLVGILQGETLAPCLFTIVLDYTL